MEKNLNITNSSFSNHIFVSPLQGCHKGLGAGGRDFSCGPWLLSLKNRRKIEPKEILSCLIPRLVVIFTW